MKKYLVAILCGLIFTVAIGWAAETFDRYKDQLAQSKRILSLESKVADLEDHVKGIEDRLKTLQIRVQEMAIQLQKRPQN
jgi:TolA-binding protein